MKKLIEYIKTHKGYKLKTIEKNFLTDEVKEILLKFKLTIPELCYRITHNIAIDESPRCKYCGKLLPFTQKHGYGSFCNQKCSGKYSVVNPESVEKRKATCERDYGVSCVLHNPEVHKKVLATWNKKYGTDSPNKSPEVQKKKEDTLEKKFGVRKLSQVPGVQEKKEATCKQNYGVEHPMQSEVVKQRSKDKCKEVYGYEYSLQSPEVRAKGQKTLEEKYGVSNAGQIHITNINLLNEEYVKKNFIKNGYFLIKDFCEFFNLNYEIAQRRYKILFNIKEPNKSYKLQRQLEVYEYIRGIYKGEIQLNTHSVIAPQELDIYMPEKKLAIEFDGLMFHSYGISDKSMFNNASEENPKYHLDKTLACESQGIQLLHIFENEWVEKKDIWKSIIAAKLGVIPNRIYARKCIIKEVSVEQARDFLNHNHLQGSCGSEIRLGLFYNNELVSLMTFGKSRFSKSYDYELLRFCNILDTIVVGGASKLLNFFRKHYNGSLISYANRRWSNGGLYRSLGFESKHVTSPNYYYFKVNEDKLYSRLKFQKHKLKDLLETFDEKLSETQNMYANDYRKIYDCGNIVYTI